jgi:hypothetical protein
LAAVLARNNVLTSLDLGSNKIGDSGAISLTDALKVNNVLASLGLTATRLMILVPLVWVMF